MADIEPEREADAPSSVLSQPGSDSQTRERDLVPSESELAFELSPPEMEEEIVVSPYQGPQPPQPDPQEQFIQGARQLLGMNSTEEPGAASVEEPERLFSDIGSNVFRALISAPMYPLKLAQVLIQLGYEPKPPGRRYSLVFRRYLYYYPGFLGYTNAIIKQDGWRALYRGLGANIFTEIIASTANSIVHAGVCRMVAKLPLSVVSGGDVPDTEPEEVDTTRGVLVKAARNFLQTSVTGVVVELIVHPFRVIVVRIIAQHIGKEEIYNGLIGSMQEIYHNEGIAGFYSGIVPALLHRVCSCFIYSTLFVMLELVRISISHKVAKACISGIVEPILLGYIPSSYSYPFALMSNIAAVNNARLVAGLPPRMPVFNGWTDSYRYLKSEGSLYRGSVLFFPRFAYNKPPL